MYHHQMKIIAVTGLTVGIVSVLASFPFITPQIGPCHMLFSLSDIYSAKFHKKQNMLYFIILLDLLGVADEALY